MITLALSWMPCVTFAQFASPDELFEEISKNRDQFGQVVFLFGDSIMRGYALGFFPDKATEVQKKDPLWSERSPASMLLQKGITATYSSFTGQPDVASEAASRISNLIDQNIIRSGDVVVMEDAGRHSSDPLSYFDNWLTVGREFQRANVTLVMMTIPDKIQAAELGGQSADLYRYSVDFNGLSHNDSTRIAAHVLGARLIDLKALIDTAGPSALHEDGIHPNVKGQKILIDAIAAIVNEPHAVPPASN